MVIHCKYVSWVVFQALVYAWRYESELSQKERCFPQGWGAGLPRKVRWVSSGSKRKITWLWDLVESLTFSWAGKARLRAAALLGQLVLSSVKGTHPLFYQLRAQLETPFTVISSALLVLFNTSLWCLLLVFSPLWQIKTALTTLNCRLKLFTWATPKEERA